jgi:hypothetical protein
MISQVESTSKIYEMTIRLDFGLIMAILLGLVLFGVIYNLLVDFLTSHQFAEGFMSILVAFGVFGTLIGIAFISWPVALMAFAGFAASGLPMIVGSITRYVRKRAKEQEHYRKIESWHEQ